MLSEYCFCVIGIVFGFVLVFRALLSEKYNIEYHGGEKEIYESVCENLSFVHSSFLIMC